jgi:hypothetical protein
MIRKYVKKPVVIEAIQYDGFNIGQINDFVGSFFKEPVNKSPYIETLEGNMIMTKGDYIIKGLRGEFYPCKPDIFEDSYEEVKE